MLVTSVIPVIDPVQTPADGLVIEASIVPVVLVNLVTLVKVPVVGTGADPVTLKVSVVDPTLVTVPTLLPSDPVPPLTMMGSLTVTILALVMPDKVATH
jgi:hypothetical protein